MCTRMRIGRHMVSPKETWTEVQRRRILAADPDELGGGILQPGPQTAGEPRVETGALARSVAEERQDLVACRSVGSHENHGRSVADRCDTAPPSLFYPGWWYVLRPVSAPVPAPLTMLASNAPFYILFGIFIVALLILVVVVLTWAIRRDRAGRAAWLKRRQDKVTAADRDAPPPGGQ
jgi:hypothetical protein